MKSTRRYVLAFCLVVCISGAVLAVTFDAHRTDVAESAHTAVEDRAERSATTLDDRVREQRRTVSLGAANPDLAAHGTDRQRRALETFVDRSAFDGASVVDERGIVRGLVSETDEESDVVGSDIGDRAYVRRALDGEQYVSDPVHAKTGNTIIVISAPIRDDGEIVGTINGAYHLEETDFFDPLRGDDRRATTVEAGGETLFSDAERFDETITATATVETVGWTVIAHQDRTAVSMTMIRLAIVQIVSGLALLGSVTVFGVWIYRSQIRRIDQLRQRVRALERREYDGGPAIGGAGDWRRIDEALTRLGETLARREQMLLVLNRILRHNLRNTLNVVIGRASDLESTLDGDADEDERRAAREIERAASDLLELADRARMTEDLLDPVSGTPRTDVATVVRERVAAFAAADAGDRRLEDVTVTGPERAMAACGEEIAVAVDELLANAAEHAGPAPTVAVDVAVDDGTDRVSITIADDGPGIPADQRLVLAGDRSISQTAHTGGIGLWLVDWLVSRYDGCIRFPETGTDDADEAARTDRGATVVLELPAAADPEPSVDRAASE